MINKVSLWLSALIIPVLMHGKQVNPNRDSNSRSDCAELPHLLKNVSFFWDGNAISS